jgi:hypothetical protein
MEVRPSPCSSIRMSSHWEEKSAGMDACQSMTSQKLLNRDSCADHAYDLNRQHQATSLMYSGTWQQVGRYT